MPSSNKRFSFNIMSYCQVKHLVLLLLVVQNTFFVLLMRYSRTRPGDLYLSSTAVCCDEAMKLIVCLIILTFTYFFGNKQRKSGGGDGGGGKNNGLCCVTSCFAKRKLSDAVDEEHNSLVNSVNDEENINNGTPSKGNHNISNNDAAKGDADNMNTISTGNHHQSFCEYMKEQLQFDFRVAGIALLFIVQKNLLYLAVSNLDAAVFQVTYQLKVLTTAMFSVVLLKRTLSYQKIAALILLTLGVALVQLDKAQDASSNSYQEQSRWVGLVAVLGACCTSGFGGVYFELVLKPHAHDNDKQTPIRPPPSVWAKNVQLSTFGLIIGLSGAFMKDATAIKANGFLQGYTGVVWGVVALQACGGLVVAAIIKYADNILKNFATAVSIVTSTIVSASLFGFSVSALFVWGCVLQFFAIYLYSKKEDVPPVGSPCKLNAQTSSIAMGMDSRNSSYADVRKRLIPIAEGGAS